MTLEELSAQYRDSANLIKLRLSELRRSLKVADDPEDIWHIKRRIAKLTPILTEMNTLAWWTENYYKIGGADRFDRYGLGAKQPARSYSKKTGGDITANLRRRIDRMSTSCVRGVPPEAEVYYTDCPGTGRTQEHCQPNSSPSRRQGEEVREVCTDVGQLFGLDISSRRRNKK